jgi:hypothetical protein
MKQLQKFLISVTTVFMLVSCTEAKVDKDGDAYYFRSSNIEGDITLYYPDTTIIYKDCYRIETRMYSDILIFKHQGIQYSTYCTHLIKFHDETN